jgi:hypothetical protein
MGKINKHQYIPSKNSKKFKTLFNPGILYIANKATKLASVWTYRTEKT